MPYIYKLTLLEDTESFKKGQVYIGQSNGRQRHYFCGGVLPRRLVTKYGKSIFLREIIIQGDLNNVLLDELEKHYIRLYACDINGLNKDSGGKSGGLRPRLRVSQYHHTGEFIAEYMSVYEAEAYTGVYSGNIRAATWGKSPAGGFYWSHTRLTRIDYNQDAKRKRVFQYSHTGEFLKEFRHISDAARYMGVSKSSINVGIRSSSPVKGYWYITEYTDNFIPPNIDHKRKGKPVYMFTAAGEYVKSFPTMNTAVEQEGFKACCISRALKNRGALAYRHQWSYSRDIVLDDASQSLTKNTPKGVDMLDIDGIYIQSFARKNDVYKAIRGSREALNRAIATGSVYKGYKWRYSKEI